MIRHLGTLRIGIVVAAVGGITSGTQAATSMTYPDITGDTVTFLAPEEQSNTSKLNYHAPTVTLDTLHLDPDDFVNPGPTPYLVDSGFRTTIMAKPGRTIESISFSEMGNYAVENLGEVQAVLSYFWTIWEVDHVPIIPIGGQDSSQFTPDGLSAGGPWELAFKIDLRGRNATKVSLALNNKLLVNAGDALSTAFIEKTQTGGLQVATPEPSSNALLSLGALAMATARRRRRPLAA